MKMLYILLSGDRNKRDTVLEQALRHKDRSHPIGDTCLVHV